MSAAYSTSASAQSYAMTMTFVKSADFYNTNMYVRAYAKLKDGSYIYSQNQSVKVYDLADTLYKNLRMSNKSSHDYLYNNILKVVNPSYVEKDFVWNNILVSASDLKK